MSNVQQTAVKLQGAGDDKSCRVHFALQLVNVHEFCLSTINLLYNICILITYHANSICIKLSRLGIVSQYTSFIRPVQWRTVKIVTYNT